MLDVSLNKYNILIGALLLLMSNIKLASKTH